MLAWLLVEFFANGRPKGEKKIQNWSSWFACIWGVLVQCGIFKKKAILRTFKNLFSIFVNDSSPGNLWNLFYLLSFFISKTMIIIFWKFWKFVLFFSERISEIRRMSNLFVCEVRHFGNFETRLCFWSLPSDFAQNWVLNFCLGGLIFFSSFFFGGGRELGLWIFVWIFVLVLWILFWIFVWIFFGVLWISVWIFSEFFWILF